MYTNLFAVLMNTVAIAPRLAVATVHVEAGVVGVSRGWRNRKKIL